MATKLDNYHRVPKQLLIEVVYRPTRDRASRLVTGEVTNKGWGKWRYGERGLLHVGDAEDLINRGWFSPVDPEEYKRKLIAFKTGKLLPSEDVPKEPMTIEKLRWVGVATAKLLAERGINNVQQIAEMSVEEFLKVLAHDTPHINEVRAKDIIFHARQSLGLENK